MLTRAEKVKASIAMVDGGSAYTQRVGAQTSSHDCSLSRGLHTGRDVRSYQRPSAGWPPEGARVGSSAAAAARWLTRGPPK